MAQWANVRNSLILASVSVNQFQLALPIHGTEGKDWVANFFVAHCEEDQFRDYHGCSRTYPQHTGTDFNLPNFRHMDRGVAAHASASGKVKFVCDGKPDRNTSRDTPGELANCIEIEHSNGFTTIYGHLKRGSISVRPGQHVRSGDEIAAVGSSGSSDGPHLHFELRDRAGNVVDPSKEGYWTTPPKHDPEFSIMDLSVQKGRTNLLKTKAPPKENIESFHAGEWITVGVFLAGLRTEEIAIGMKVGSRQCIKIVSSETEIQNHMIFWAPFCFLEDGPGSIVVFKDREPIPDAELEVQCLSSP